MSGENLQKLSTTSSNTTTTTTQLNGNLTCSPAAASSAVAGSGSGVVCLSSGSGVGGSNVSLNNLNLSNSINCMNNNNNNELYSTSTSTTQSAVATSGSVSVSSRTQAANSFRMSHTLSPLNHRYVKLNVGGRLFATSLDTLTKQDNMLRAMFSGRMDIITDSDGYIIIDRCGKHFELLLNYLRDEDSPGFSIYLDDKTEIELYELLKEAKFYCIQPLINLIEQKIISNKSLSPIEPYYGSSVVSMVTSKNDLNKILSSTDKPCIRLLINRHNNKYSYTNNSDDNLLKNIELFERMAIKFKNRIMFIKDTTSNEEICCWYFHGNGRKLAEVCCTSIVYTTEKKQTKVEFPDSKILEEIFVNAVLFESKETASNNENPSNQSQSTITSGGVHHGLLGDDDSDEQMPRITISSSSSSMGAGMSTVVNCIATSSTSGVVAGNLNGVSSSTNSNGVLSATNAIINTNVINSSNSSNTNMPLISGQILSSVTSSSSAATSASASSSSSSAANSTNPSQSSSSSSTPSATSAPSSALSASSSLINPINAILNQATINSISSATTSSSSSRRNAR